MEPSPIEAAVSARNRPGQHPIDPRLPTSRGPRDIEPVPVDYHPGGIRGESSGAQSANATLGVLHEAWNTIKVAADSDMPLGQVATLGERALSKALANADKTIGQLAVRESNLETKIREAVQPKISDSFAGEIRTFVRLEVTDRKGKMDGGKLSKITQSAKGDKRVASAILEAPAILSGLTEEAHDVFRRQIVHHFAEETDAELQETRNAREHLEKARDRAISDLGPKIASWKDRVPEAGRKLKELAR